MMKDQWQYLLIYLKFHYSGGHYFREIVQWNEFKATETRLTTNWLNNFVYNGTEFENNIKKNKEVFTFLQ